ncbi:VOC family protein [Rhizobium halophytocola]|uniref:Catechol 2,3-dioxygenase-like lactoylglutathione lyase family enzyme n=1 Tax=Rhizobium halophytocola TaxID=735519 RepID=A0ABS4DXQ8_9HYPH|nr:VOC family protein [Rhizobium halophytocola]MBP1850472.1 catechol 2,3-dioxygenase-like lactoylglutathione lyase family enzyme [Rhizobium halophytocola]
MSLLAIDHVQLAMPVGGEDKARAFYEGLLGIPEVEKPDNLKARGGCWFAVGNVKIHLGVEEEFRPSRKAHPAFLVEELKSMMEQIRNAGHEVAAADIVGDYERFHAFDPFGNRIEFMQLSIMSRTEEDRQMLAAT